MHRSTLFTLLHVPCALALLMLAPSTVSAEEDHNKDCKTWAEIGECDKNPNYMNQHCAKSCGEIERQALKAAAEIAHIKSFFDLEANDIDGNMVKFEQFRGKVTVVVNVASYCGYTESHYRSLVALHKDLVGTEKIEILAFPCNQFGKQEPEECPTIKRFAQKKGVEFTMMDKIDVNGPDASPVYKYLKKEADVPNITWNFATYFVVSPEGNIQSFSGVEPLELKDTIVEMIDKEL